MDLDESDAVGIDLEEVFLSLPVYGGGPSSLRGELVKRLLPGRIEAHLRETQVPALQGVSLSLRRGDRIGLLGHNGAGKSSLLRLLAGIYWPTGGRLEVRGTVRCLFGLNPGIEEEASGFENIEILSRLLGYPKHAIAEITDDVADFCELGEALKRPVRTYSNGMKLRLCFGVITAWPADILLIDEVIGVGDRDFKVKAAERMKNLIFRSGILVLASHDGDILKSLVKSAIRMESGKIIDREFYDEPDPGPEL